MKRKIIKTALVVVGIVFVMLLLVVNYFYGEAVKRGMAVELYRGEETMQVMASPQDQSLIEEANVWFDQQEHTLIELESYDDLILKAKLIENDTLQNKAVILAHGYRSTSESMGQYAKFYYDQGFDVLIPDARGHGESEGDYIGYGWHDRLDYLGWIELLIDRYKSEQILMHGNSMGASAVLMTSGEDLPEEVKGIIADSGYTTVKEELTHQLRHLYNLPAFPLLHLTSIMTVIRSGYSFEEASALNQVKENNLPIFLVHGEEDELVPTEMAKELYEAAAGGKELWLVPGAGHTDAYDIATEEYQDRLVDFIKQTIK
ncbi:alpha/beta hydrolase [Oceanobacillus halophilus]|uniref:Alpha/beta hydrolase n=1 Tax=Oceanobacillus halophilus TaxID=930130 RepID=A0A495A478_9BACI|nr:alpha/beta hydrolase [Oceanobacillus halophilus]RKQ33870.1 alpha/beta hydrolase [Oceanobacillus halophilus]